MNKPSNPTYFVQKEGVYSHGVFWIGTDLDEAKRKADTLTNNDRDDYHQWVVYQYEENTDPEPKSELSHTDAVHNAVYTGVRTEKPNE